MKERQNDGQAENSIPPKLRLGGGYKKKVAGGGGSNVGGGGVQSRVGSLSGGWG